MSGSKIFYQEHRSELTKFVHQAQLHCFGNPDAKTEATDDGASFITYQDGDWTYKDQWYGGEPFSGMAVVHYQGKPCWSMVYWGRIMPIPRLQQQPVLDCLIEALMHPEPTRPLRGLTKYTASNGYRYRNAIQGGIRRFSGEETIIRSSKRKDKTDTERVYEMNYRGGVIDTD